MLHCCQLILGGRASGSGVDRGARLRG